MTLTQMVLLNLIDIIDIIKYVNKVERMDINNDDQIDLDDATSLRDIIYAPSS